MDLVNPTVEKVFLRVAYVPNLFVEESVSRMELRKRGRCVVENLVLHRKILPQLKASREDRPI